MLNKRHQYSKLLKTTTNKSKLQIYKQRKSALKWILVTSFGYLGFNNAKFGRIDAHMAVCAFARKLLLDAIHIAEEEKFAVLHGIVDSIWVQKKGATKKDYASLGMKIAEKINFDFSLDIYNWIVFLPSKENTVVPVANRYFGAKKDEKSRLRALKPGDAIHQHSLRNVN